MNNKKIFATIVIVTILGGMLFVLTGCSNNNADDNNNDRISNGVNNDNTNENNNNDNLSVDNEGRLVSGKFSIEYPEGWEWKNNGGDPEAHDPNSNDWGLNAFIQITTIGITPDSEDINNVKIGNYTFLSKGGTGSIYAPVVYYYVHNSHTVAMISFYLMDTETIETVLSSFRVD